jgi:hypothetical protein
MLLSSSQHCAGHDSAGHDSAGQDFASQNFVFVHVPRTAGSSIVRALQPHCLPQNNSMRGRLIYRLRLPALWQQCHFRHHQSMQAINVRLPASVQEGMFSFAFVRNPYDWLVSLYEYQRQASTHRNHDSIRNMDFPAYVRHEIARNKRHQWPLLCDRQKQPLVQAIGRYENLQRDFNAICQRIGLTTVTLPHVNHSRHRSYQDYYDDQLRAAVARHWRTDLNMLGYDFSGCQQGSDLPIMPA